MARARMKMISREEADRLMVIIQDLTPVRVGNRDDYEFLARFAETIEAHFADLRDN